MLTIKNPLDALRQQLQSFEGEIKADVAIEGAAGMALVIYEQVKENVETHKQSGLLYNSIYRKYSPEKSTETLRLYRVSWNHIKAPHGHLLEYGTSRAPAYPFVRPALSRVQDAIAAGQKRMATKLQELKEKS